MMAIDLGVRRVDEALRLVRALGSHRYVAGRLHLAHAFAVAAVGDDAAGALAAAREWALTTLGQGQRGRGDLDLGSRDERLWRRCSDAELAAVLDAYWTPGSRSQAARGTLRGLLEQHGLPAGHHAAFDESVEDQIHPLALDAGWELLRLQELHADRHKGAIASFGDDLAFESACFEEETAIPSLPHLYELPAVGATELLDGANDDGTLKEPFILWVQGNETYLDYVFRGICRAARLE
ncbi:MAG TPA: hypothetical protein VK762_12090 [Polyangiaceae bacterium]|jgi:hypothetical protein|nr:hypothetical protein [Polyangiaceae bacterium]